MSNNSIASKYVQSSGRLVVRPVCGGDMCSMYEQTVKLHLLTEQALKSQKGSGGMHILFIQSQRWLVCQ